MISNIYIKKQVRYILLTCFLIVAFSASYSQSNAVNSTDSTELAKPKKRVSFFDLFSGKPGRAALYSFVLPGGGQLYNRKYWKVPLALAIDGFTIYNIVQSRTNFNTSDKLYRAAITNPALGNLNQLRDQRNRFRKQYEYSWVYFTLGRIVGVLDAYVDRHLMNFDISENLSLQILPYRHAIGPSFLVSLDKRSKYKAVKNELINLN